MRRGLSYHNRRSAGGYNPFSQLGPTLDLIFAGNVTNLSDPNGFTLDANFLAPQYLIGEQYTIWETGVGLVSKTFSQIITFTRASTGTYFDSAGVLQTAAINDPRFDYNPSTLVAQGLLIEEARTNLVTRSEEFNDAAWTKTNSSITANATTAPSGTATADKLIEALDVSQVHQVAQTGVTVVSLATYTVSVFVKADTRTRVRIAFIAGGGGVTADANLTAGTIGAATAFSGGTAVASSIQAINNGWYRISVAGSGAAGTSGELRVELLDASGNRQYNGDGTSGLFLWGAQLEAGAFATSYIPTTTTALTRSADVAAVNTLSPWFNSTGGTLYAESFRTTIAAASTFPSYAEFDNGALNRYGFYNALTAGTNEYGAFATDAGVSQAAMFGAASRVSAGTVVKQAAAFATNDFAFSVNGSSVFTDTVGTLPSSVNRMCIGSSYIAANFANAWIRRITYYPRRLSNAELQSITA